MQRILVGLAGVLVTMSPSAQGGTPEVRKSLEMVRKHIDNMEHGKGVGELIPPGKGAVQKAFPDYQMVIVRFRQFPVARVIPEGLHASNIFAVNKEGKLEYLKDVKTLQKFFRAHGPAITSEKDAKLVLAAWLSLTPEFHQDGMFKFEVLEKEFAVADNKASGRATVMSGGNGQLTAVLLYDKDGKLAKVEEKAAIRAGPRPICQATKLLDADPLVRRIAEQDLLIMGLAAREYMMEQRDRAAPELRNAIERVWRQMQKNGW